MFTANQFIAESDTKSIQAAIMAAKKAGSNTVVIPRFNERTGENIWIIDDTILLPDEMTVLIDGAHLRMENDVMCHMFRNEKGYTQEGKTLMGEQHGINIIGKNGAIIDGGKLNNLGEFNSEMNGLPSVWENLLIYFHNVRDFRVEGLKIRNQRWWAMAFMYSRYGTVTDLTFEIFGEGREIERWRNQDGVDLRVGCNNIIIQNLRGEVGDDMVALTALMSKGSPQEKWQVEGKDPDIHDVTIRSIYGITNMCAIVRMLNHWRCKLYNIDISDIHDMSRPGIESRSQMIIRLGDDEYAYYGNDLTNRVKHGETYNIRIHGIYSRALCAIHTSGTVKNLHVSDVFVHTDGQYVWYCGNGAEFDPIYMYLPEHEEVQKHYRFTDRDYNETEKEARLTTAENVILENVFYTAKSLNEEKNGALNVFNYAELKNVTIKNVLSDSELSLVRFRYTKGENDLRFE